MQNRGPVIVEGGQPPVWKLSISFMVDLQGCLRQPLADMPFQLVHPVPGRGQSGADAPTDPSLRPLWWQLGASSPGLCPPPMSTPHKGVENYFTGRISVCTVTDELRGLFHVFKVETAASSGAGQFCLSASRRMSAKHFSAWREIPRLYGDPG